VLGGVCRKLSSSWNSRSRQTRCCRQQLAGVQQQLVQTQQLLLELPKQLLAAGETGLQQQRQQQQADHVHMAVRTSISGLQELLQLQS